MTKQKTEPPSCFISYCHKDADFEAIAFFERELSRSADQAIEIHRDKNRIQPGGVISTYEQLILDVDVAIVLFTPEYANAISRRHGGAYREFCMISDRFRASEEAVRKSNPQKLFAVIPIVFAGAFNDVIPTEFRDLLCEDFVRFRTTTNKDRKTILPDSVQRDFAKTFADIADCVIQTGIQRTQNFLRRSKELQTTLLMETKYELVGPALSNQDQGDVLNQIFVKTSSFRKVRDQGSLILVGRKGSGKSTIADHLFNDGLHKYHCRFEVDVDRFKLATIMDLLYTPDIASDVRTFLSQDYFFELVWRIFVYLSAANDITQNPIGHENTTRYFGQTAALRKIVEDVLNARKTHDTELTTPWPFFVWSVNAAVDALKSIPSEARPDPKYFWSDIAAMIGPSQLTERIFGSAFCSQLEACVRSSGYRYLFVVDGFDTNFERFRIDTVQGHFPPDIVAFRNDLERDWLKGLLHSVLQLRSNDKIFSGKLDFCIAVPSDRFIEVRGTERDAYRYRTITTTVRWTGIELAILLRKRLEVISGLRADKEKPVLARLEDVLKEGYPNIPFNLQLEYGGTLVEVSLFTYLLRHTFWRPRDILYLLANILTASELQNRRRKLLSSDTIRRVVSFQTHAIIDTEFIGEFRNVCVNIEAIVQAFKRSTNILSYQSVVDKVGGIQFDFVAVPEHQSTNEIENKILFLYEIGFLGYRAPDGVIEAGREKHHDIFHFSHGLDLLRSLSSEEKSELLYLIHPIFNEYLRLEVSKEDLLNFYSDDFLEENDTVATEW